MQDQLEAKLETGRQPCRNSAVNFVLQADVLTQAGHGEMSRLRADLAEVLAQELPMSRRSLPIKADLTLVRMRGAEVEVRGPDLDLRKRVLKDNIYRFNGDHLPTMNLMPNTT